MAAALGRPLLPHQRYIVDVAGEIDVKTGLLAYSMVVVVKPRQNGKTELLLPVMTHRCLGFNASLSDWVYGELGVRVPPPGPQRVLYTTQTADKAREKWRDTHLARIEGSPLRSTLVGVRKRLNAEAMVFAGGSSWSPGSTTGKTGGTGDTLDLGVIDEAWSRPDDRTELGMRPAMVTRDWRQLWVASMIPGLSRAAPGTWPYLKKLQQVGRARVEAGMTNRVAYFEWCAPDGADPADPATWWTCMPALGHTIAEKNVAEDFEAFDLVDFSAEYLGWTPEHARAEWSVIWEGTWSALADPQSEADDPVALAIDGTPDLSAGSIGMAGLRSDGNLHIELIDRREGVAWLVPTVVQVARVHGPCAIGLDVGGPVAALRQPLIRALAEANLDIPVIGFNGREVAGECAALFNETGQLDITDDDVPALRRVRHLSQPELDAAVASAQKYTFGDQWRWKRPPGGADVSPLYVVTLARGAGERVEWTGGSYDIRDSLG